jgi:hypothetical protein
MDSTYLYQNPVKTHDCKIFCIRAQYRIHRPEVHARSNHTTNTPSLAVGVPGTSCRSEGCALAFGLVGEGLFPFWLAKVATLHSHLC